MKTITNGFKEALKSNGRELSVIIEYDVDNTPVQITNEDILSIDYVFESNILKSLMKELTFTSKKAIAIGTRLHFQFGLKVNNAFEYIDYGYFYIKEREQHRENKTYTYTCYDKMLYTMVAYPGIIELVPGETTTLDNYIHDLASYLGMTFVNYEENYTNNDLVITADYWVSNNELYTIRDVLDQIAEVVGGNIIVNENEDLEIIYPTDTNEVVNGDYLSDTNIQIDQMYGVINSITSTRADGTDNVNVKDNASVETNGETEITLVENLMLGDNNRLTYLQNILDRLDGLSFAILDINTIGVPFFEVGDIYRLKIGGNLQPRIGLHPGVGLTPQQGSFKCLMLSSSLKIESGFNQQVYTDKPRTATLDFVNSNANLMTDKQTQIIVDKQLKEITISANQINLEGYTTINDGFSVDLEGNMVANSGKISKFDITDDGLIYYIYAPYDYDNNDLITIKNIIINHLTPTPEQLEKYDLTGDGEIKANDYVAVKWYVSNHITTTIPGTFVVEGGRLTTACGFRDGNGVLTNGFGFEGGSFESLSIRDNDVDSTFNGNSYITPNSYQINVNYGGQDQLRSAFSETGLTLFDDYGNYDIDLDCSTGNITCVSLTQTSQEDKKKNFEKLENGLDIIKNTDIYKYNFKTEEDNDKKHIGLVIGNKYKYSEELTNKDNTGVDTYAMVSVCFKAIQEQQKMIEDLQKQIKKLTQKESE